MSVQKMKNGFPPVADLKNAARGRWPEILADAGIPSELLDGRGHPCPVCRNGRNRFAAFRDVSERGAVHCRVCFTSGSTVTPGDGIATLQWIMQTDFRSACEWLARWLGMLNEHPSIPITPKQVASWLRSSAVECESTSEETAEMTSIVAESQAAMTDGGWQYFVDHLGLPIDCLQRMGVGWSSRHQAMTWPMEDDFGNVIGIRLRSLATGKKWSVRGGRSGVFVPSGLVAPLDRLYIGEGPTDTAALLSVGLPAIGRSSASGSLDIELEKVRTLIPTECVILADRDSVGLKSATRLAFALLTMCRAVRVLTPPEGISDAREWVQSGVTKEDIERAADQVTARSLEIRSEVSL